MSTQGAHRVVRKREGKEGGKFRELSLGKVGSPQAGLVRRGRGGGKRVETADQIVCTGYPRQGTARELANLPEGSSTE
jgi:hypothetical protein